jgi:hypothetical protein
MNKTSKVKSLSDVSPKDRVYKLKIGTQLAYTLASRNHPRFPLMCYDEKNTVNRALRYASNQNSPFEDEQDGNAILEPIIFEDGFLSVPKTNPVLQKLLYIHPLNGIVFQEVDKEKDAEAEVEDLNAEVDALIKAKELTIEEVEILTRVMFGKDPSVISTAELKRDILVYAKTQPKDFLLIINDPELQYSAKIRSFFQNNLLSLRNNDKEVWYNTPTNKKKMMSIPYGEDPYEAVGYFLKSDEGLDGLRMLETTML